MIDSYDSDRINHFIRKFLAFRDHGLTSEWSNGSMPNLVAKTCPDGDFTKSAYHSQFLINDARAYGFHLKFQTSGPLNIISFIASDGHEVCVIDECKEKAYALAYLSIWNVPIRFH